MQFSDLLRARLKALIEKHDMTPTGLAKAMDRPHTWIVRKLDANHPQSRPLRLEDCDEVITFLKESPKVLLSPVLCKGDMSLLVLLNCNPGLSDKQFANFGKAFDRLKSQNLLDQNLKLTHAGKELLSQQA